MNKLHFPKQSFLAAGRRSLIAKASVTRCLIKRPPYQIYCCPCECGPIKEARGINQYHECQFIRLGGSSDGEMSTTNLFNSLILHFNPSLIPSLFRSGCLPMPVKEWREEDSKQRQRGIKTEWKSGGLKRRKEQTPDTKRRKVEEKGKGSSRGREMVGLWSVLACCHFKSEFTV